MMEGEPEGSEQQSCSHRPHPKCLHTSFHQEQLHRGGTSQGGGGGFGPSWGSLLRFKKAPCVFKEAPVGSAGGRKVKMISWC